MNTKPLYMRLHKYKIIRYLFLGSISTAIHLLVAMLYISFIKESLVEANVIAFLIAYIFSYLMQSKYVFNNNISVKKAMKYFVIQFSSLLISLFISSFFTYDIYMKTLITVMVLPLITYLIHKFWTFK